MVTPYNHGPIHAEKRQCGYWYSVAVRHLVNRTYAIKTDLNTRKIQMQVTAVARPRNYEDPTDTAIRLDGGFLLP